MNRTRQALLAVGIITGLPIGIVFIYYALVLFGPGTKYVKNSYAWGHTEARADFWGAPEPFSSLVIEYPKDFPARIRFRNDLPAVLLSELTSSYLEKNDLGHAVSEDYCEITCPKSRGFACYAFYNANACFWRDGSLDHLTIGLRPTTEKQGLDFLLKPTSRALRLPLSSEDLDSLFESPLKKTTHRSRPTASALAH